MAWYYSYKLEKRIEFDSDKPCCMSCLDEQDEDYSGAIDDACCCRHHRGPEPKWPPSQNIADGGIGEPDELIPLYVLMSFGIIIVIILATIIT